MKTSSRFLSACLSLTLLIAIAGFTGCSSKQNGGEVVATVDGHKIYRSDLDKYYDNQTIGSNQPVPTGEQATSLRLNILRELIDNEIVMHRAEKLGLLATDDEVDRKLNEIKSPFSNEQFDARLKERKITLDDFKKDLRRSLTVDKVINKEITSKVNVSDQDISNYYNQHKSEFNLIEPQYHIAQIVVTTTPSEVHNLKNDKAQNEAEARRKIQMLQNHLESGDDFATLAMNYSEDADTATNGGDLGFAPESSLKNTDPSTRDAVMKLKAGENSPVIQIVNPVTKQFIGFRIVKLLAKEPAGQRELSDPRVQQAIHEQLRDRREQLLKSAYYEMLHDQARVENYYAEQVIASNGTLQ
ncbi:MAG TPA: SurA N-terminal domain-containing protein [Terriglobales bacterium]